MTKLKEKVSQILGQQVTTLDAESTNGDATLYFAKTQQERLFVKTHKQPSLQALESEAQGLEELQSAGLPIPTLLHHDPELLIIKAIKQEPPSVDFWRHLARSLVQLHKTPKKKFGYKNDNWIGAAPQKNRGSLNESLNWGSFFWKYRLLEKFKRIEKVKRVSFPQETLGRLEKRCLSLLTHLPSQPTIVHGDLWSGNVLCGPNQSPYFIDPAVYYGDREVDIAMTQCFGGFAPEFYQTYQALYPLNEGYEERRHIYNLYHMLNHWEIFGTSYESVARRMIQDILSDPQSGS